MKDKKTKRQKDKKTKRQRDKDKQTKKRPTSVMGRPPPSPHLGNERQKDKKKRDKGKKDKKDKNHKNKINKCDGEATTITTSREWV